MLVGPFGEYGLMARTRALKKTSVVVSPFPTAAERKKKRDDRRQALLAAAVRMFNERGFHTTSLDDVAASLGVTRPVVYHYLGNKDQVLFECLSVGLAELQEAADRAQSLDGSGLEQLRAFMRRWAEVSMNEFGKCIVGTDDSMLSPESCREFRARKAKIDRALRQLLKNAVTDGSAKVDDVRLTAFTLAGALNWPARWYREDGSMSAATIARKTADMLCAGLCVKA